jgi:hypothetical protein
MTATAWMLCATLITFYCCCLFTVCPLTFRKGHIVLGIAGIFVPILWLLGARLSAKRRSPYAVEQSIEYLRQVFADERRAGTTGAPHAPRLRWEYPGSEWKDW